MKCPPRFLISFFRRSASGMKFLTVKDLIGMIFFSLCLRKLTLFELHTTRAETERQFAMDIWVEFMER